MKRYFLLLKFVILSRKDDYFMGVNGKHSQLKLTNAF